MLIIALVACLSGEPKCGIVRTYETLEACETGKAFLQQNAPIPWAPLHCEDRSAEKRSS